MTGRLNPITDSSVPVVVIVVVVVPSSSSSSSSAYYRGLSMTRLLCVHHLDTVYALFMI